jgi:hypothetical protein
MWLSLNDVYYAMGLGNTNIGNDIGWSIDDGLLELDFSSQLNEKNQPCLVVGYKILPTYNFRD